MRICRLGPIAVIAGGLLAACNVENVRGAGSIQAQVQLPGHEAGSVAYTGQITAASKPAIPSAFTCINSVGQGCYGASVSQGAAASFAAPLVDSGNNTTVSSYIELSQVQPGAWTLDFKIKGSVQKDIKLCGIPVASGKKTSVTIAAGGLEPSASYQVGDAPAARASICQ
jgi:UDP-N-acetylmuramyl tripeptide synthase